MEPRRVASAPPARHGGNRTSRKTYAYTAGTLGAVLETASYLYDGGVVKNFFKGEFI